MHWFELLTGFPEESYAGTRSRLKVDGNRLYSLTNGRSYGIGTLELISLQTLRERAKHAGRLPGRIKVSVVTDDVRKMHAAPQNAGALFQVASQFNLLEMVGPTVTPEDGVTRYQHDHTQGPACAIAAGAATIYRNYFARVGDSIGQTSDRQLDGLAELGAALSDALKQPVNYLWKMKNGYALCTRSGLDAIAGFVSTLDLQQLDMLRAKLCIGIHHDVEVTDAAGENRPFVTQAFCSALPVSYTSIPPTHWKPFASLILEASYEATMWAALLNAFGSRSKIVFLTMVGGGAFGNVDLWIFAAMRRALRIMSDTDLDVRIVSYGERPLALRELAREFSTD